MSQLKPTAHARCDATFSIGFACFFSRRAKKLKDSKQGRIDGVNGYLGLLSKKTTTRLQ
jgi:hypothetical protein